MTRGDGGDARTQLAERLFGRALLRGSFKLRSGATSDRYFDKYRVTTDPGLLAMVAAELDASVREHAPGAGLVVAPELGAVPLAAALALYAQLPYIIVRAAGKQYGTANRIEGTWQPGQRAVLVEDVVTSGGAALDALEAARAAGIDVACALCVLDREAGGGEALAAAGAPLHALLGRDDLDRAFDAGLGIELPAVAPATAGAGNGAW